MKEFHMATAKRDPEEGGFVSGATYCEPLEAVSAEEIVALRKELNVSQSDLARRLGISVRVLQSWEQGARSPSAPARALLRNFWRRSVTT